MPAMPQKPSETTKSAQVLSDDQHLDVLTEEVEALDAVLSDVVNDAPHWLVPIATKDMERKSLEQTTSTEAGQRPDLNGARAEAPTHTL